MLSDLCQHFLNDDKLIRHKGKGRTELCRAGKTLNIENRVVKGKQAL